MIGKRLINTGVAAAEAAFTPSEHFETVTYTGNGGTQRIGGYINRGGVFNGSSSRISISQDLGIGNISENWTISFWVQTNATTLQPAVYARQNNNFSILVKSDALYYDFYQSSSASDITISTDLTDFVHLAFVHNASAGTITPYINGTAQTSKSTSSTQARSESAMYLGSSESTSFGNLKLDQFRIFNKALSSSEVTTLYGETYASSTVSTTDIFSDNSGVALYQLDGNANDTGGVSGKFGSAAIFNGSSSKIVLPTSTFSPSTFTLSAWCNVTSDTDENTILELFDNQTYPNHTTIVFSAGSSGYSSRFLFRNYTTNQYDYNPSGTVQKNVWKHYVMTYDGSTVKSYIDGSLVDSGSLTLSNTVGTISSIQIGLSSGTRYLNGKIDDVRIYSDVLTSTEVGYIYNNTSIPTDNLVAYYKLDGDARDEQQQYDGTATNVSYAYDGTATNVTYQEATKFQPDLVWIKPRSIADNHNLFDSIRGATKQLISNLTSAESTQVNTLTSFDSNGFTIGSDNNINTNNATHVAWCFKGGGTAVSNTDGTITSQVSANTAAGFSIVSYTGTGSNTNFGHGLDSSPELTIIKNRDDGTRDWIVHPSSQGTDKYLILNGTNAINTSSLRIQSVSSTVVNIGTNTEVNANGQDFICYNFHSVDGYQKIGSYTGNGSATGPIVTLGFAPRFVMIKNTSSASHWFMEDNVRDTGANPIGTVLFADLSNAEQDNDSAYGIDFNSNGFQIKTNYVSGNVNLNTSGQTYIYLAIA